MSIRCKSCTKYQGMMLDLPVCKDYGEVYGGGSDCTDYEEKHIPSLREIGQVIDESNLHCHFCEAPLDGDAVCRYDHDGGIMVKDFPVKQWVYVHCRKCGYDWALWKLRGDIEAARETPKMVN